MRHERSQRDRTSAVEATGIPVTMGFVSSCIGPCRSQAILPDYSTGKVVPTSDGHQSLELLQVYFKGNLFQ